MSKSIRLHPKYGVNPTMGICFWCRKPDNTIGLLGSNKGKEAPTYSILSYEPCQECKDVFAKGVLLIEASRQPIHDNQAELCGAYPTGRYMLFTDEGVRKSFDKESAESAIRHRKAFLDKEAFDILVSRTNPLETDMK